MRYGESPLTLSQARQLIEQLSDKDFSETTIPGYRWSAHASNYGGVRQRWLVVESEIRRDSDLRQLDKNLEKAHLEAKKKLRELAAQTFACEPDALTAVTRLSKQLEEQLTSRLPKGRDPTRQQYLQILGHISVLPELQDDPQKLEAELDRLTIQQLPLYNEFSRTGRAPVSQREGTPEGICLALSQQLPSLELCEAIPVHQRVRDKREYSRRRKETVLPRRFGAKSHSHCSIFVQCQKFMT